MLRQEGSRAQSLEEWQPSFPDGPVVENPPANAGDTGLIPGLERSPGEGRPTPVFLPGESHGQRSLVGYSPQGHTELDTTEAT